MWKEWQHFWFCVEEWWSNLISMVGIKKEVNKELKDQGTQTEKIIKDRYTLFEKIKWKF